MNGKFEAENAAYDALKSILVGGAYSSVALDRILGHISESARAKTTALVYGTLDKSVALDYAISLLAKRAPKPKLAVLLKLALYEALFGGTPVYAAADKYVTIAKTRMRGSEKFVNAVMRAAHGLDFPKDGEDPASVSVEFSRPESLVKRMFDDFGPDRTRSILAAKLPEMTHIRRNRRTISEAGFSAEVEKNADILRTDRGYYVSRSTLKTLDPSVFTAQSLASVYAAEAYTKGLGGKVRILDLCAAPGGKSVYMSELLPEAEIIACDVHPHRVNLIKSYAARMKAINVTAVVHDATVPNDEWKEAFDFVVCDVPCTGSGLLCTSPDILLGKSDEDVSSLAEVQSAILSVAAGYVAHGGRLAYSTCSLLTEENEAITDRFISSHPDFVPLTESFGKGNEDCGRIRFFPDTDGCDGFYIARYERT